MSNSKRHHSKKKTVIAVTNLHKSFRLPHESHSGVKQYILSLFKRNKPSGYETQKVLRGIDFKVEKGDFFGIVGRNGSGKSTLLKMMAGIYEPDQGKVDVDGSLVPFIELGVGFNPELTGRENVFLNGALLGLSRKEMEAMYDDIVEFAELEKFMDQRLKNYSSGMQVRLAFSIAIRADADILLLDEVLAVGDEAFQRKCYDHFKELKRKKKTVILVTHGMENVRKFCNKAMLIKDGKIEMIGSPDKVADEYYGVNLIQNSNKTEKKKTERKPSITAKIIGKPILTPKETLEVEIKYKALNSKPVMAKAYVDFFGQPLMATNPRLLGWENMITSDTDEHTVRYSLPLKDFNRGEYKIVALLEDVKTKANINSFGYDGEMIFKVSNPDKSSSGGVLTNRAKMELKHGSDSKRAN